MSSKSVICPVCTLYLRPGMTLTSHLSSHPKQKVISALVKLSSNSTSNNSKELVLSSACSSSVNILDNDPDNRIEVIMEEDLVPKPEPIVQNYNVLAGNHSFIYQQFLSTSSHQTNQATIGQPYILPTVFNSSITHVPQMSQMHALPEVICAPYVLQQQPVVLPPIAPSKQQFPIEIELEQHPQQNDEHQPQQTSPTSSSSSEVIVIVQSGSESSAEENFLEKRGSLSTSSTSGESTESNRSSLEDKMSESSTPERLEINGIEIVDVEKEKERMIREFKKKSDIDLNNVEFVTEGSYEHDFYFKNVTSTGVDDNNIVKNEEFSSSIIPISNNGFDSKDVTATTLENLNMLLPPDFSGSQFISRVENFENVRQDDNKKIIMNLGCLDDGSSATLVEHLEVEESLSQLSGGNVSIRADEHMPAKGELSGAESNATSSDTVWSQLNYEDERSWDASENSFVEIPPPFQSRDVGGMVDEKFDAESPPPATVSPKTYKCFTCEEVFDCLKERRSHVKVAHRSSSSGGNCSTEKKNKGDENENEFESKTALINDFGNVFTVIDLDDSIKPFLGKEKKTIDPICCNLCDLNFKNLKELHAHVFSEHNLMMESDLDSKRHCSVCEDDFETEAAFTKHLQIHPLACPVCSKNFNRKVNLQLHLQRHLGIKPYKCVICDKLFYTKQKLKEHKNVHTGEAPIKCSDCPMSFRRYSNMLQHRNRVHLAPDSKGPMLKKRDYFCSCGDVFRSKKKLAWHEEIHESKPKACLYCSEKFVHASSLTRHMRRAHNQQFTPVKDNEDNVECPVCNKVYLRSSLDAHLRSHSGEKAFTCSVCNKDFTTKWNLKLHKWTHAARSSKPFKCDQCKGAFIRESEYVAHMNAHRSVKPYTCNHCGAQFIRKYNCQRHVKEHLSGKSFSCNICGKTFHRSYYLKDHMRIHNGARPFSCHICGKTSTTKSNHNKHVRIHHAREPVTTEN